VGSQKSTKLRSRFYSSESGKEVPGKENLVSKGGRKNENCWGLCPTGKESSISFRGGKAGLESNFAKLGRSLLFVFFCFVVFVLFFVFVFFFLFCFF